MWLCRFSQGRLEAPIRDVPVYVFSVAEEGGPLLPAATVAEAG